MVDINPSKKLKRTVKNPESFRERTIKANAETEQSKRSIGVLLGKLTVVLAPIRKSLQPITSSPAAKTVGKPLKVIGRVIFPKYFRTSFSELKQVTWPTLYQSRQLTLAVLIFAAIFGASIAVLDFGLDKFFRHILVK